MSVHFVILICYTGCMCHQVVDQMLAKFVPQVTNGEYIDFYFKFFYLLGVTKVWNDLFTFLFWTVYIQE